MRTAVVTDTNSGIMPDEAKRLGVFSIPMPIIIDEEIRLEGVNLTNEQFFESQIGGREVSSSMPSPGDVMDLWDEILKDYDQLVYMPMSSGLSASCSTAAGLAEDYDGRVEVIDNHRISVTLRIAVLEAKKLADEGKSAAEIKDYIEKTAYDSSIYIACDTLRYLKKGGRVTPAGAAIATALNLKPVLTIQGGKLDAFAKVRGMKKARDRMVEAMLKDRSERFGEFPDSQIRIGCAGSGLTQSEEKEWTQQMQAAFPGIDVYYDPLGLSIGVHIGPGGYGCGISVTKL